MTQVELDLNVFPKLRMMSETVDRWLTRVEKDPARGYAVGRWVKILERFSVDQVLGAADKLMLDEKQPREAGQFPVRLKGICEEAVFGSAPKAEYHGGERIYRCNLCKDSGGVLVFLFGHELEHHKRTYPWDKCPDASTIMVACDRCGQGAKHEGMTRFKQGWMEPWDLQEEYARRGLDFEEFRKKGEALYPKTQEATA